MIGKSLVRLKFGKTHFSLEDVLNVRKACMMLREKARQQNRGKWAERLKYLIETLYAEVKNKDGEDFEPDSLGVTMASVDRHLNEQEYKFSTVCDRVFH